MNQRAVHVLMAAAAACLASASLASPKSESWGEEMRAHMKAFEKDKVAMAAAKKACDKLKPSVRLDEAKCVAVSRRTSIDAVRTGGPIGL